MELGRAALEREQGQTALELGQAVASVGHVASVGAALADAASADAAAAVADGAASAAAALVLWCLGVVAVQWCLGVEAAQWFSGAEVAQWCSGAVSFPSAWYLRVAALGGSSGATLLTWNLGGTSSTWNSGEIRDQEGTGGTLAGPLLSRHCIGEARCRCRPGSCKKRGYHRWEPLERSLGDSHRNTGGTYGG